MRNIGTVIDKMLEVIPVSEKSFISALEDIMSSVRYSAPESMGLWWEELTLTINGFIPYDLDTCEPWEKRVAFILMNKDQE